MLRELACTSLACLLVWWGTYVSGDKIQTPDALEKIALDDLVGDNVDSHLTSIQSSLHDTMSRSEMIVSSLDGVWAGAGVVTGNWSSKLQPFVDYTLTLEETLRDKHVAGGFETETTKLDWPSSLSTHQIGICRTTGREFSFPKSEKKGSLLSVDLDKNLLRAAFLPSNRCTSLTLWDGYIAFKS